MRTTRDNQETGFHLLETDTLNRQRLNNQVLWEDFDTSVSTEFLLLGVRGNCPFLDQSQMNWIEAELEEHSTKPEVVRELIDKVSPPPRLELFRRRTVPDWCVWGDAIQRMGFEYLA